MDQVSEQGVPNPRGRKSVPWRRDPAILARLPRVERLHLAGRPNTSIAAELGLDEKTVRNDLARLAEIWLERTATEQADARARVLAELEDVRVRALEAAEWDQMCERAVLFGGSIEDEDGPNSVYRDKKGSAQFRGNKAAALAQARQATMDKAKLLGLVVDKAALTDGAGDDIPLDALMERFARRQAGQEATEGDG
jgi:hypothetical protein